MYKLRSKLVRLSKPVKVTGNRASLERNLCIFSTLKICNVFKHWPQQFCDLGYNDTHYNDIQHYGTQHNNKKM
jgi:hypothetical protein